MENNVKYYLMRSPESLVKNNMVGYGWKKVNFSDFKNHDDVLNEIKSQYGSFGRKKNQIKRFFGLKKGDVVVTPMKGSIAIGMVVGDKSYDESTDDPHGFNQVSVDFHCECGKLRKVSTRTGAITNKFLARLRVRQTNISLSDFSDEIDGFLNLGCTPGVNDLADVLENKLFNVEDKFKKSLLKRLASGNGLRIKGGGDGFEELVCELLELEGFSTKILSKKSNKGKGDIDIEATRDEFWGGQTQLVIQAKHHKGISPIKSLQQVVTAIDNGEVSTNAIPMVISTGVFGDKTTEEAGKHDVVLIDGDKFIDWLYRNLLKLSPDTRLKLGISNVPCLI